MCTASLAGCIGTDNDDKSEESRNNNRILSCRRFRIKCSSTRHGRQARADLGIPVNMYDVSSEG